MVLFDCMIRSTTTRYSEVASSKNDESKESHSVESSTVSTSSYGATSMPCGDTSQGPQKRRLQQSVLLISLLASLSGNAFQWVKGAFEFEKVKTETRLMRIEADIIVDKKDIEIDKMKVEANEIRTQTRLAFEDRIQQWMKIYQETPTDEAKASVLAMMKYSTISDLLKGFISSEEEELAKYIKKQEREVNQRLKDKKKQKELLSKNAKSPQERNEAKQDIYRINRSIGLLKSSPLI